MIVRESIFEETRNEIRAGKFAFISPVRTSTEASLRRQYKMNSNSTRHLCKPRDRNFDFFSRNHHQICKFVNYYYDVRQRFPRLAVFIKLFRFVAFFDFRIKSVDVPDAPTSQMFVTPLHFTNRPFKRDRRAFWIGNDRCCKMRNVSINTEFKPFRIDVTPPFLYAGDSVRLPIQVVNTTDGDISTSLAFAISGATLSGTGGAVKVPAGGNALQYVTMSTTKPGVALFKATLGSTDAIEKSIELKPAGRREIVSKAGTLAAPRTFPLSGPANPLPGTEAVRVRVYPGALGLIRNELSAAPGRGGVAEDAYLLQLLGQAPALLIALGAKPDEPTIRDLSLLATQRVMQYSRSPSVDTATLLTEAALAHPQNPVLARLGERLALAGRPAAARRRHLPGRQRLDPAAAAGHHLGLRARRPRLDGVSRGPSARHRRHLEGLGRVRAQRRARQRCVHGGRDPRLGCDHRRRGRHAAEDGAGEDRRVV